MAKEGTRGIREGVGVDEGEWLRRGKGQGGNEGEREGTHCFGRACSDRRQQLDTALGPLTCSQSMDL